jgi:hypothetical protein
MAKPDERKLQFDLHGGPFVEGELCGWWKHVQHGALAWPNVLFWISAAPRRGAPSHYYIRLDCHGYPNDPPTGTFWDLETESDLALGKRPWGVGLVARVFRTDWKNGCAFYHPYDRTASRNGHSEWRALHPYWIWDNSHTVVDLLCVIYELLNSAEYTGVREPG